MRRRSAVMTAWIITLAWSIPVSAQSPPQGVCVEGIDCQVVRTGAEIASCLQPPTPALSAPYHKVCEIPPGSVVTLSQTISAHHTGCTGCTPSDGGRVELRCNGSRLHLASSGSGLAVLEFDFDRAPDGFRLLVSDCLITKDPGGPGSIGINVFDRDKTDEQANDVHDRWLVLDRVNVGPLGLEGSGSAALDAKGTVHVSAAQSSFSAAMPLMIRVVGEGDTTAFAAAHIVNSQIRGLGAASWTCVLLSEEGSLVSSNNTYSDCGEVINAWFAGAQGGGNVIMKGDILRNIPADGASSLAVFPVYSGSLIADVFFIESRNVAATGNLLLANSALATVKLRAAFGLTVDGGPGGPVLCRGVWNNGAGGSILTGVNSNWASLDVDASGPAECAGPAQVIDPASMSAINSRQLTGRIVVKDRVVEIDRGKSIPHSLFSGVLGQIECKALDSIGSLPRELTVSVFPGAAQITETSCWVSSSTSAPTVALDDGNGGVVLPAPICSTAPSWAPVTSGGAFSAGTRLRAAVSGSSSSAELRICTRYREQQ